MKKFILFIALFVVSSISVTAQTGGLKGKVRNSKGSGIPSVTITARQDGKDIKTVKSDGKGNFIIQDLENGVYNLVFDSRGYSSSLLSNVEVKKNKLRELPDSLILSVDQGTLVIIRGSVFNQDGRSVTGAEVTIERLNSDGSTRKMGSVYTNVSGEFTFRQPEGAAKFRLTAKLKDQTASKEVEVDSAAIYRLALNLTLEK
ncbi:MAG: carboxypeptidase-like regulatory domain-containing protein [Acidobacteriota bacterium]|nr:carboxypeptidase-like regulatory domain-containing protein [Acidobacteriota bacterium]